MVRLAGPGEVRPEIRVSRQQARNLHLAVQGLLRPPRARATRARLLAALERMRLLQIDTINVVARSPYLVLFSRLGAYETRWLDELLARGRIFECWAHEACFAPIGDYGLHAAQRHARSHHWAYKHAQRMHREHRRGMDRILAHVRECGAVKASDFERERKGESAWWGWKDEKRWLEAWFALGELMIARREKFQRVYDLRERVLARIGDVPEELSAVAARREMILGGVAALGIAQAGWIADYFRTGRKHKDADLDPFVASGQLVRVAVRGWKAPAYVHQQNLALLQRAQRGALRATHTTRAVAVRSGGVGPRTRQGDVRFRLHHRVLHAGAQAPLRLFRVADPASRPTWSAASTPRRTGPTACSRSRTCTWKRASTRPCNWQLKSPPRCNPVPRGTRRRASLSAAASRRRWRAGLEMYCARGRNLRGGPGDGPVPADASVPGAAGGAAALFSAEEVTT